MKDILIMKSNPNIRLNDIKLNRQATLAGAPTKLTIAEIIDDETGEITYNLMSSKLKMDDEAKAIVLSELAAHGRLGTAGRAAGVTVYTVQKTVKNDPEFGKLVGEALECYKDELLAHHQDLVFNGQVKKTYDREGRLMSSETVYPIRLIEMELKKHDAGYRDKREVGISVRGGVLVAPSTVESVDDWEKKFGKPTEVIEGEVIDVTEQD